MLVLFHVNESAKFQWSLTHRVITHHKHSVTITICSLIIIIIVIIINISLVPF